MNKLYWILGLAVFCFCLLVLTIAVSKDKKHWSATENITSEYDIPKELEGCKVYKIVNVQDTTKSFYTMQCK